MEANGNPNGNEAGSIRNSAAGRGRRNGHLSWSVSQKPLQSGRVLPVAIVWHEVSSDRFARHKVLVLPAAVNNPDPFKSESANGGRMTQAAAAHLIVIGASPGRPPDRLSGKLVEGLPDKVQAGGSSAYGSSSP